MLLPRFEIETTLDLADILSEFGMHEAFSVDADFSGVDGGHNHREPPRFATNVASRRKM